MTFKEYEFHELADIFPLMEGDEFEELVDSINEHGQLDEGVLYEEKILDGRNRYNACKELDIEFETKPLPEGIDPFDYVIAENLIRRHLNLAQRATIALIYLDYQKGIGKDLMVEGGKKSKPNVKEGSPILREPLNIAQKSEIALKFEQMEQHAKRNVLGGFEYHSNEPLSLKVKKHDSYKIAAKKAGISTDTLTKAKKITEVAQTSPTVAELWERAKQGKASVKAVHEIAEIPHEGLRKQEVKQRERSIELQSKEAERKKKLAKGEISGPLKVYDADLSLLKTFQKLVKDSILNLTIAKLEGYGEKTKKECIKIMKFLYEHLKKELKEAGEVIPYKVIEVK